MCIANKVDHERANKNSMLKGDHTLCPRSQDGTQGEEGVSYCMGIMGLPQPVTPTAFSTHNKRLWELAKSEDEKSFSQAAVTQAVLLKFWYQM